MTPRSTWNEGKALAVSPSKIAVSSL